LVRILAFGLPIFYNGGGLWERARVNWIEPPDWRVGKRW
jgi:hypothetical protein